MFIRQQAIKQYKTIGVMRFKWLNEETSMLLKLEIVCNKSYTFGGIPYSVKNQMCYIKQE